jgi:hypothetical protein
MKLILIFTVFYAVAAHLPQDIEYEITSDVIKKLPLNTAYIACTDEKYMYCQNEFNTFIGYQGSWTDVTEFQHAINTFFKQDVSGLLKLCQARTHLFRCFATEYDSCTSRLQFIKKGANMTSAYQLSGTFNALDFECSGGAVQAVTNWPCIWTTWNSPNYQTAKAQCLASFYNNTFNSYDQVCIAGQTLAKCLSLQFSVPPCNINDLTWFECERIVNFFQFDGLCPNIRCKVSGQTLYRPQTLEEAFKLKLTHNFDLAAIHLPRKGRRNHD